MNIAVIGTGFVGVTTAAVYASHGHAVYGLDIDEAKIAALKEGTVPFFEPDLEELLQEQQQERRLHFTTSYTVAVPDADIVMIAVGTPSKQSGEINDSYVVSACESVAPLLKTGAIVVIKSTVPPVLLEKFRATLQEHAQTEFYFATMPEFLKEGTAVADTQHPDRIVIGSTDAAVVEVLEKLHEPFAAPLVVVSPESAQMIKYASNSYLAQRITFINQISDVCEKVGADVDEVIGGMGLDKRIGSHYWYPGLGYGGSCFPKDVRELGHMAEELHLDHNLFAWTTSYNQTRPALKLQDFENQVGGWEGMTVAVLGLSFKPNTDDTREAPAQSVIPFLLDHGATVRGYDPKAKHAVSQTQKNAAHYRQSPTIEKACQGADCIMVLIEWPEFLQFDFSSVAVAETEQFFIDARNQFDPEQVGDWGFTYIGIGK